MKRKVLIAFLIQMVVAFSLCGCGDENVESARDRIFSNNDEGRKGSDKDRITKKDIDVDELKEKEGLMFSANQFCWGLVDGSEDYWDSITFNVFFDGTIRIHDEYNLSGIFTMETTISDDDYEDLYLFAANAAKTNEFADINVDACDGDGWSFIFVEDGEQKYLYSGYTYGVKELENIQEMLYAYVEDGEFYNEDGYTLEEVRALNDRKSEYSDLIYNTSYKTLDRHLFGNVTSIVDGLAEAKPGENVIYSDTSLNMALGLLVEGADGDTAANIMAYMYGSDYFPDLFSIRDRNNALINIYMEEDKAEINLANSIFYDDEFNVDESYEEILRTYYGALAWQLDFQDSYSAEVINDWCDEKTKGRIKEIVNAGDLANNRVILANALYFNSNWMDEFDEDNISEEKFTNSDGSKSKVTMMSDDTITTYYENKNATGFAKYYEGNGIAFIGILPKEEGDFSLEQLDIDELLEKKYYDYEVHIKLPKFTVEDNNTLNDVLMSCGLEDIFDPDKANFSLMGDTGLVVSDILQKTYVDVNEKGTEAAAVTVVEMKDSAAMVVDEKEIKEVYLDRPFVFMIYDFQTEDCLFIGKINQL